MTEWASRSVASSQRCMPRQPVTAHAARSTGCRNCGGRRSRKDCDALLEVGPAEALDHQLDGLALGGAETGVELGVDLPLHRSPSTSATTPWPGRGRSRWAAGSTSSAGSARLTRPIRAASSPLTLRAEYSRSRACGGPTSRVEQPREAPLGDQPALGERRRQHGGLVHEAQVAAPARSARPSRRRPVDGGDDRLGHRHEVRVRAAQVVAPRRRRRASAPRRSATRARRRPRADRPTTARLFMSAPAQKPLPAPVITMPTTAGSRSASPTASRAPRRPSSVHALSGSGRLRVMVATGSSTS